MVAVPGHSSNVGAAFVGIDSRFVIAIDDGGGAHCPKCLSQHVHRKLAPWELPKDAVGEGDSGVDMPV